MHRFYLAAVDLLPGALLLIPVFLLLNMVYFRNVRKSTLYFLFSCYLCVIYVLVGLPTVTYIRPEINLNPIPFIGMIADFKNSILNILLFLPLGVALPILWHRFQTAKATTLFGFGMSLTIELLQMLTFRATDVNDLITNTLGTFFGFLCAKSILKKSAAAAHTADLTAPSELVMLLLMVLIVMFFVYPFVSAALWDFILS